eukprot:6416468-Prymnesium_polylepis.1
MSARAAHLGAAEDGEDGLDGRVQDLGERRQLLGHQQARRLDAVAIANHRRVRAVRLPSIGGMMRG